MAKAEADYGEEDEVKGSVNAKPEPQRVLPDYGDLIDDDVPVSKEEVKDDNLSVSEVAPGKRRPEALHVSGVQRLTRTHLEEVLDSKRLPRFDRLEWISDEIVLLVFAGPEDAAKALAGARSGFGETMSSDEAPGPGLWRAQRGYLDFRFATDEDRPGLGWRRQHRAGKQVREFRFWEAIKDLDASILGAEDRGGGEHLISEPPRKRRRGDESERGLQAESVEADDDDGPDLLQMMAQEDRRMLESVGHAVEVAPSRTRGDDDWNSNGSWGADSGRGRRGGSGSWGGGSWDDSGGRRRGSDWNRHSGDTWNNESKRGGGGWGDASWSGGGSWDREGSGGGSRKRQRGADSGGGRASSVGDWGEVDDTERKRRSQRSARFQSQTPTEL
eukprot:TRINITY_DN12680_c0_g1_i1.p1 TRINITY_DN12680_c0_g1~~TRINITY_DN12680_c0_g1_i1.p1  ORF type:complete len:387 (-),score=95.38 TRINITY_DN12680_c0_g1_i1:83-1243(-)